MSINRKKMMKIIDESAINNYKDKKNLKMLKKKKRCSKMF